MIFFWIECSTFFMMSFSVWPSGVYIGGEVENAVEVCWETDIVGVTIVRMGVEASVVGVWKVVGCWTVVSIGVLNFVWIGVGNDVLSGWIFVVVYILEVGWRVTAFLFWN